MSSSITNAMATLDAPNEYRTLYSITVNCTISPNSTDDTCEVIWLLLMINFLQVAYIFHCLMYYAYVHMYVHITAEKFQIFVAW